MSTNNTIVAIPGSNNVESNPAKQVVHDFPTICAKCLGNNPYLKMVRNNMGEECKMCQRVYSSYSWKREKGLKPCKTMVCNICATTKNICQSCLIDLEYGLPSYIRDNVLSGDNISSHSKKSQVSTIYETIQTERMIQEGTGVQQHALALESKNRNENVLKVARFQPYSIERSQAISTDGKLKAPEDKTVKTLYFGPLPANGRVTEDDLRMHLTAYGPIRSIKMNIKQNCAFVTFMEREDAEIAAESLYQHFVIKGAKLNVMWAKQKSKISESISEATPTTSSSTNASSSRSSLATTAALEQQKLLISQLQQQEQKELNLTIPEVFVPAQQIEIPNLPTEDDEEEEYSYNTILQQQNKKK